MVKTFWEDKRLGIRVGSFLPSPACLVTNDLELCSVDRFCSGKSVSGGHTTWNYVVWNVFAMVNQKPHIVFQGQKRLGISADRFCNAKQKKPTFIGVQKRLGII